MGFYWFLLVLRIDHDFSLLSFFKGFSSSLVQTVSLTICIRCDHLLIGHHSRSGIVNLKVRKGRRRRGKEVQNVRENGEKLSDITHAHTYTLCFSEQKK